MMTQKGLEGGYVIPTAAASLNAEYHSAQLFSAVSTVASQQSAAVLCRDKMRNFLLLTSSIGTNIGLMSPGRVTRAREKAGQKKSHDSTPFLLR